MLAIVGFSAASIAGERTGTIGEVHLGPAYGTKVFLRVDGTGDPDDCNTNADYHFAFDADSAVGRALLATVLAAQASQQNVVVGGYGVCTLFGNVEDLRWVRVIH